MVILQGPGADVYRETGLEIISAGNEVRALQITGWTFGIEIDGTAASNNVIAGCYIGTDGTTAIANTTGIRLLSASNNRIGTNGDGIDDVAERNVISGNVRENVTPARVLRMASSSDGKPIHEVHLL